MGRSGRPINEPFSSVCKLAIVFAGLVLTACSTGQAPVTFDSRVEELVELLRDPESRKEARTQILALGDSATDVLLRYAGDADANVRWEVVNALGASPHDRAFTPLITLAVKDANHHVRWRSLWALANFRDDARAVAALKEFLPSWNAAVGLSMFGSTDGLVILHEGVRNPDPFRRWEAINALGRVHDEKTVEVLSAGLGSPSDRDRTETVMSLGHIGGPAAVELLERALRDPSPDVRWRAAMMLGTAGGRDSRAVLEALLQTEKDPTVLSSIRSALATIK